MFESMPSSPTDRIALVTGSGRGIGRAIAERLGSEGALVVLSARRAADIETVSGVIESAGGRARTIPADLADREACRALVDRVEDDIGPIDILVNNAGIAESAPLHRTDDGMWDRTMALNVVTPFSLTRRILPGMIERGFGRIVNVASTAGRTGYAYTAAYTASKHGLIGMTRAFSKQGVGHGVTVNAVCPGYVDTDMTRRTIDNIREKTGLGEEDVIAALVADSPIGRLIRPDEVADAVAWLCSERAAAVSGQTVGVCGGAVEG